jgi:transposase
LWAQGAQVSLLNHAPRACTAQQRQQQWKWHRLGRLQVQKHRKYHQAGRPGVSASPDIHYTIEAQLEVDQARWDQQLFQRSLFVLATNQVLDYLDDQEALLRTYKEQHSVERGFRFIKDPNVVASSFFVKKPERVAALLFVMATCLLVYSALEYRIRKALKENDKSVPDQKGKPTQNPTARWVFQLFVGIHALTLPDEKKIILNLKEEHRNILALLSYWNFYS